MRLYCFYGQGQGCRRWSDTARWVQAGEQVWWPRSFIQAQQPQDLDWTIQQCFPGQAASGQACHQVHLALLYFTAIKLALQSSNTFWACMTNHVYLDAWPAMGEKS